MKKKFPFQTAVIDTMIFIYLFEDISPFAAKCEKIFDAMQHGNFQGIMTPVTLAEILVKPLQENRADIADKYRSAIDATANLATCAITPDIGAIAGALRGKYDHPLPDLFQIACAIEHGAAFITNDKALRKIAEVPVFTLNSEIF